MTDEEKVKVCDEMIRSMMSEDKKETIRPRGTDGAKVMQVIVTKALEGRGTEADPCFTQLRVWTLDGELLAIGKSPRNEGEFKSCQEWR